jgi:hypothetical protein
VSNCELRNHEELAMSERIDKDAEVLLKLSGEVAVGRGCVVEEVPFIDGEVLVDDLDRGGTSAVCVFLEGGFPVYEGTCSNW